MITGKRFLEIDIVRLIHPDIILKEFNQVATSSDEHVFFIAPSFSAASSPIASKSLGVREDMPIQEEEKASGKPGTKARQILKPSSTSGWDFTPMEQRQWIHTQIQESKDLYCFQVSKFITRLLRYSQQVYREEDAGVHFDQGIDECKKKLSDDTGYWSDEMKKQFANAPYWSSDKWISVLAKGGGQRKRLVSILLEHGLSSEIPVLSINPRTFRKYN